MLGVVALELIFPAVCFLYKLICLHISSPKRSMLYTSKSKESILAFQWGDILIYSAFFCFVFSFLFTVVWYLPWHSKLYCWPRAKQEVLLCKMFKTVNVFLLPRACSSWLSALDCFYPSTHSFGFLSFI